MVSFLDLVATLVLTSCSTSASRAVESEQPGSATAARTLVMVGGVEEPSFARKPLQTAAGVTSGGASAVEFLNATLAFFDDRGAPHPYLAETLPQLETAAWRVLPDGKMETTYALKPNLRWHDGTPLTSEDFVFAWRLYATPAFGLSASPPMSFIEEVAASDLRTIVIRWKQSYPGAGQLAAQLPPLPRQLLELPSQELDPATFVNLTFWIEQYVGAGPYRLDRREPGISLEAVAFDGHVLGRPRIDRIRLVYINDPNTILANLLSGLVDYAAPFGPWGANGLLLERDWVARNRGVVLWYSLISRGIVIQMRPEFAVPRQLATDARVRQAIAYAIDREAAFAPVTDGRGLMSDTFTHPYEDYYDLVSRVVTKYRPDPRKALGLLDQAGFTRGVDGILTGPTGDRFALEAWYFQDSTNQRENVIVVDQLRSVGIDGSTHEWASTNTNNEQRSKLPGIFTGGGVSLTGFRSSAIPGPETRWVGGNRGGFSNPEVDRLAEALDTTLDRGERIQKIALMEKVLSEELPAIFQYNTPRVVAHVAALRGPTARLVPEAGSVVYNIHEWNWAP